MRITNEFLIKTSFTIALLGMLLLTIASRSIKYDNHKSWTMINSNANIKIRGRIINMSQKKGFEILTIEFNTTIEGICSDDKIESVGLKPGEYATISGSISRGKMFIEKIEK